MTRDPARIARILEKIRLAWERHPDLRLGQLLTGAVFKGRDTGDPPNFDLFNVEDDETERALDRWRAKSPINFSVIARRVPPPPAVIALWKRLRPFIEGKND